jgi:3-methyl-2-oxobutanoate hydroxymethyltransferase
MKSPEGEKVRIQTLQAMKEAKRPIAAVTAYDAIGGRWADQSGLDFVLVGDSLGNTALGLSSTVEVTLEMMIHHCAAVSRGVERALLVGDMPFMSAKVSPEQALTHCGRMIQEGRMEAVKLEGGNEITPIVERLVMAGLPVMGHIGLLPQSVHAQGGYRVQGRDEAQALILIEDAMRLEDAGAFAVVIEGILPEVAGRITEVLSIPTIGIGAGLECDGQVLVLADLLGLSDVPLPKFVRPYGRLGDQARQALERYAAEVRDGSFPGPENLYG